MSCGCNNRNRNYPLNNLFQCCQQCRCNPCSCSVPTCQESECASVCTSLVSDNSWNVPACDSEAVISFPGLSTILIGTYLYNPTYGRFLVNGFNSINGQVTVENTCLPGNATPGTIVPAGTEFVFSTAPELTEYADWSPVITAGGAMTVSGEDIHLANSFVIGTTRWFQFSASFTLGGVANGLVYFTLPDEGVPPPDASVYFHAGVEKASGGVDKGGGWRVDLVTPTKILVIIEGAANFPLGVTKIDIQGFYQIAP